MTRTTVFIDGPSKGPMYRRKLNRSTLKIVDTDAKFLGIVETKHLPGQHDQQSHGTRRSGLGKISNRQIRDYQLESEKYYKTLYPDEDRAIAIYAQYGYIGTNVLLREGEAVLLAQPWVGQDRETAKKIFNREVSDLDKLFDKAELKENVVAYRGIRGTPFGKSRRDVIGTIVEDKGYTSVSLAPLSSEKFMGDAAESNTFIELHVPKGQKVIYGKEMESEYILQRGLRYKITNLKTRKRNLVGGDSVEDVLLTAEVIK